MQDLLPVGPLYAPWVFGILALLIATGLVVPLRVLTSRKLASDTSYGNLFQDHPAPMYVYDRDTLQLIDVNDAAVAVYGYSREEFQRLNMRDIRPKEDIPQLLAFQANPLRRYMNAGVWRHRRKDGSVFMVEITSHAVRYGRRDARMVLARDVSADVEDRAMLALLCSALSAYERPIAITDASNVIKTINRAFSYVTGYRRSDVVGMSLSLLEQAPGGAQPWAEFVQELEGARRWQGEKVVRRRDGGNLLMAVVATPAVDDEGVLCGVLYTLRPAADVAAASPSAAAL